MSEVLGVRHYACLFACLAALGVEPRALQHQASALPLRYPISLLTSYFETVSLNDQVLP